MIIDNRRKITNINQIKLIYNIKYIKHVYIYKIKESERLTLIKINQIKKKKLLQFIIYHIFWELV